MKRYPRIADAQIAMENIKNPEETETRIWGFEIVPFLDKDTGDVVEGIRNYCIFSINALYHHLKNLLPHRRNFYEVIYGKCHLFIDYDLAMPSTHNVNDAHAEITRVIKEILAEKIETFGEKVLVAARSPHKQSMHVKFEFYDKDGRSVVFSDPLACRRFISEVIRRSIEQRGFDDNPLFYCPAGSDVPACILDLSIYNPNRNFRLAGNTKSKLLPEQHRGWLLPRDTPDELSMTMPSLQIFRENLATLVSTDCVVLDPTPFPDIMDHVRSLIKARGRSDPNIEFTIRRMNTRRQAGESSGLSAEDEADLERASKKTTKTFIRLSSSSARMQSKLEPSVLKIVEASIPAQGHKIVETYLGVIIVRLITYQCGIKGSAHRHNMCTFCKVYLGYPLPRVFLACKKDKCIAKIEAGFDQLEVDIEPNEEYTRICDEILSESHCNNPEDFF